MANVEEMRRRKAREEMMSESPADALKRVEARIALAESYVNTYRGAMRGSQPSRGIMRSLQENNRQQYEAWLTQLLDAKAEWHKLKREEAARCRWGTDWLRLAGYTERHAETAYDNYARGCGGKWVTGFLDGHFARVDDFAAYMRRNFPTPAGRLEAALSAAKLPA